MKIKNSFSIKSKWHTVFLAAGFISVAFTGALRGVPFDLESWNRLVGRLNDCFSCRKKTSLWGDLLKLDDISAFWNAVAHFGGFNLTSYQKQGDIQKDFNSLQEQCLAHLPGNFDEDSFKCHIYVSGIIYCLLKSDDETFKETTDEFEKGTNFREMSTDESNKVNKKRIYELYTKEWFEEYTFPRQHLRPDLLNNPDLCEQIVDNFRWNSIKLKEDPNFNIFIDPVLNAFVDFQVIAGGVSDRLWGNDRQELANKTLLLRNAIEAQKRKEFAASNIYSKKLCPFCEHAHRFEDLSHCLGLWNKLLDTLCYGIRHLNGIDPEPVEIPSDFKKLNVNIEVFQNAVAHFCGFDLVPLAQGDVSQKMGQLIQQFHGQPWDINRLNIFQTHMARTGFIYCLLSSDDKTFNDIMQAIVSGKNFRDIKREDNYEPKYRLYPVAFCPGEQKPNWGLFNDRTLCERIVACLQHTRRILKNNPDASLFDDPVCNTFITEGMNPSQRPTLMGDLNHAIDNQKAEKIMQDVFEKKPSPLCSFCQTPCHFQNGPCLSLWNILVGTVANALNKGAIITDKDFRPAEYLYLRLFFDRRSNKKILKMLFNSNMPRTVVLDTLSGLGIVPNNAIESFLDRLKFTEFKFKSFENCGPKTQVMIFKEKVGIPKVLNDFGYDEFKALLKKLNANLKKGTYLPYLDPKTNRLNFIEAMRRVLNITDTFQPDPRKDFIDDLNAFISQLPKELKQSMKTLWKAKKFYNDMNTYRFSWSVFKTNDQIFADLISYIRGYTTRYPTVIHPYVPQNHPIMNFARSYDKWGTLFANGLGIIKGEVMQNPRVDFTKDLFYQDFSHVFSHMHKNAPSQNSVYRFAHKYGDSAEIPAASLQYYKSISVNNEGIDIRNLSKQLVHDHLLNNGIAAEFWAEFCKQYERNPNWDLVKDMEKWIDDDNSLFQIIKKGTEAWLRYNLYNKILLAITPQSLKASFIDVFYPFFQMQIRRGASILDIQEFGDTQPLVESIEADKYDNLYNLYKFIQYKDPISNEADATGILATKDGTFTQDEETYFLIDFQGRFYPITNSKYDIPTEVELPNKKKVKVKVNESQWSCLDPNGVPIEGKFTLNPTEAAAYFITTLLGRMCINEFVEYSFKALRILSRNINNYDQDEALFYKQNVMLGFQTKQPPAFLDFLDCFKGIKSSKIAEKFLDLFFNIDKEERSVFAIRRFFTFIKTLDSELIEGMLDSMKVHFATFLNVLSMEQAEECLIDLAKLLNLYKNNKYVLTWIKADWLTLLSRKDFQEINNKLMNFPAIHNDFIKNKALDVFIQLLEDNEGQENNWLDFIKSHAEKPYAKTLFSLVADNPSLFSKESIPVFNDLVNHLESLVHSYENYPHITKALFSFIENNSELFLSVNSKEFFNEFDKALNDFKGLQDNLLTQKTLSILFKVSAAKINETIDNESFIEMKIRLSDLARLNVPSYYLVDTLGGIEPIMSDLKASGKNFPVIFNALAKLVKKPNNNNEVERLLTIASNFLKQNKIQLSKLIGTVYLTDDILEQLINRGIDLLSYRSFSYNYQYNRYMNHYYGEQFLRSIKPIVISYLRTNLSAIRGFMEFANKHKKLFEQLTQGLHELIQNDTGRQLLDALRPVVAQYANVNLSPLIEFINSLDIKDETFGQMLRGLRALIYNPQGMQILRELKPIVLNYLNDFLDNGKNSNLFAFVQDNNIDIEQIIRHLFALKNTPNGGNIFLNAMRSIMVSLAQNDLASTFNYLQQALAQANPPPVVTQVTVLNNNEQPQLTVVEQKARSILSRFSVAKNKGDLDEESFIEMKIRLSDLANPNARIQDDLGNVLNELELMMSDLKVSGKNFSKIFNALDKIVKHPGVYNREILARTSEFLKENRWYLINLIDKVKLNDDILEHVVNSVFTLFNGYHGQQFLKAIKPIVTNYLRNNSESVLGVIGFINNHEKLFEKVMRGLCSFINNSYHGIQILGSLMPIVLSYSNVNLLPLIDAVNSLNIKDKNLENLLKGLYTLISNYTGSQMLKAMKPIALDCLEDFLVKGAKSKLLSVLQFIDNNNIDVSKIISDLLALGNTPDGRLILKAIKSGLLDHLLPKGVMLGSIFSTEDRWTPVLELINNINVDTETLCRMINGLRRLNGSFAKRIKVILGKAWESGNLSTAFNRLRLALAQTDPYAVKVLLDPKKAKLGGGNPRVSEAINAWGDNLESFLAQNTTIDRALDMIWAELCPETYEECNGSIESEIINGKIPTFSPSEKNHFDWFLPFRYHLVEHCKKYPDALRLFGEIIQQYDSIDAIKIITEILYPKIPDYLTGRE